MIADALGRLAAVPELDAALDAARQACTDLRWHPALRRRADEARAEAGLRAARSSAALSGARLPLDLVRDAARGAAAYPDDAVGQTVHGAVRAFAEAEREGGVWQRAPLQALARLHTAAAAGLLPPDAVGRPRAPGESPRDGQDLLDAQAAVVPAPDAAALTARLAQLVGLLTAPPSSPALLVAGLAHAEVATARPFLAGNAVVARALSRAVVVDRGLDPTAVVVWEAALLAVGPAYPLALAGYATRGPDGVVAWLLLFAQAIVDGALEGRAVCDAVLAGRLP